MDTRNCLHCGNPYEPTRPEQKYCRKQCGKHASAKRSGSRARHREAQRSSHRRREAIRQACARKVPFPTAEMALLTIAARRWNGGGTYKCKAGDHWHITSDEGPGVVRFADNVPLAALWAA